MNFRLTNETVNGDMLAACCQGSKGQKDQTEYLVDLEV